jgi:membrane protease YdiL (CAAX protease family)
MGALVINTATSVLPSLTGPSPGIAVYNVARQTGILGAIFGLSVGVGWIVDRRRLSDYGLGLTLQWLRDAGFGLGIGFALPTLILLTQVGSGYTTVTGFAPTEATDMFAFGSSGPGLRLGLLLMFFLVQATFEEFLIRGYLLTNIAEGLSGWLGRRATVIAVVFTGGLFGVLHWRNPSATLLSALNISLYGILLGGCYVFTGQLGIATGFHIAWNYTLSLWDFPVSGLNTGVALIRTESTGPAVVTGGGFGPEGGLLALGAFIIGTVGLWWWLRREYDEVEISTTIRVPDLRLQDVTDRSA